MDHAVFLSETRIINGTIFYAMETELDKIIADRTFIDWKSNFIRVINYIVDCEISRR